MKRYDAVQPDKRSSRRDEKVMIHDSLYRQKILPWSSFFTMPDVEGCVLLSPQKGYLPFVPWVSCSCLIFSRLQ